MWSILSGWFSWKYLILVGIGGFIAYLNNIGLRGTIKYLLKPGGKVRNVLMSFFGRNILTVLAFFWIMQASYKRLLAMVLGFTLVRMWTVATVRKLKGTVMDFLKTSRQQEVRDRSELRDVTPPQK